MLPRLCCGGVEFTRRRSIVAATGQAVLLVLLVSLILPALNGGEFPSGGSAEVFICLTACLALATWSREGQPGLRLTNAAAIATLVAGGYLTLQWSAYSAWPYELWMVVACALALLVLALSGARSLRIERPSVSEAAAAFAGVLVLVSLFLPWQGHVQGWRFPSSGGIAGGLVVLLLIGMVARRRVYAELAIGAALFVASAGFAIATGVYGVTDLGYGALLGLIGAGLLLLVGVSTFRSPPPERLLLRSIAFAACLGLLSFVVAVMFPSPLSEFVLQSPWFLSLGFLGAMTVLISLRLLLRWTDAPAASVEVVLLPLGLLAVTVLTLIYLGTGDALALTAGVSWEGWVSAFLCLLLAVCGWIERRSAYTAERTDGSASITSLATSP